MEPPEHPQKPKISIVGPCTSGKSTLTAALRNAGYPTRQPAQEHSYVSDMWQQLTDPDILIYLDVSYPSARQRRPISWGAERLVEQAQRLAHARQHADLYLNTDILSPDEVQQSVFAFLKENP